MAKQNVATYLPDCLLITLRPAFDAFSDPDDMRGIVGPEAIGFFFHEWVHYVHNVSTLQGLTAFANLVNLWANFRHSIDDSGFSKGAADLNPKASEFIGQIQQYLVASRQAKENEIPLTTLLEEITIESLETTTTNIGEIGVTTTIVCNLQILNNATGSSQREIIKIGTHEIIEGAAWMLETKLTLALRGLSPPVQISPYQLVKAIARFRFPEISDDLVIMFMLSALQDSDPPAALMHLFQQVAQTKSPPEDVLSTLTARTLKESRNWVEKTLGKIEDIFPQAEQMALAVKSTTATIRRNLAWRETRPFFEFDVIAQLRANPQQLTDAINMFGCCAVIQERPGYEDKVGRDLLYDLVPGGSDLEFGWRKMHASFRFVGLHLQSSDLLPTNKIPPTLKTKCPFYTICNLKLRTEKSEICKKTPWESADNAEEGACWYGAAIVSIRPPARL